MKRPGIILFGTAVILAGTLAVAQQQQFAGSTRRFKYGIENFPPPHESQIKLMLEGASSRMDQDGKLHITGVRLRIYRETGEVEAIAETPECVYDTVTHCATSAAHVQASSADGDYHIEGDGFFWQQTNSFMMISNNVRSHIRSETMQR